MLSKHGVELLHAKEFHDRKNQFKGWSPQRQLLFVQSLFDVARGNVTLGMSVSVRKDAYEERRRTTGLNPNISAYAQCFGIILNSLVKREEVRRVLDAEGISFRVEAGNKNNNNVKARFDALREIGNLRRGLKSLSFIAKDHSVAIQLADFLAFYSRRQAEACEAAGGRAVRPDPILEIMARTVRHAAITATTFGGETPGARAAWSWLNRRP